MADNFIQVAVDGAGKKMQTQNNTVNGNDVHAEAVYIVDPNGVPIVSKVGAANQANGQVTTSGTAGTLVIARSTRRSCMVINTDTSIAVYIGAATVSSSTGVPLGPGQSFAVTWVGLVQVIAASGTPVVAYWDEYD